VYEGRSDGGPKILCARQVLKGMTPTDAPADYQKKNRRQS